MNANVCILTLSLLLAGCTAARRVDVENPSDFDRESEMVEVSVSSLGQVAKDPFVVSDAAGTAVPWQLTHDGKLIFQATVPAGGKASYRILPARRFHGEVPPPDTLACGSWRKDRLDDIAWENDLSGFRAFGPRLQASGAKSFGYDVFTKSVRHPVLDERYRLHHKGKSYHVDHGTGMDAYEVGPTLGCGTSALIHEGQIVYPWCYKEYEILDNGPLRFTVRLTFGPLAVGKDTAVVESRLLSLDAGSYLNKVTVRYDGLSEASSVAAGIVVHKENPGDGFVDAAGGILAYPDLGGSAEGEHGQIFCGVVRPEGFSKAGYVTLNPDGSPIADGATGHLLGVDAYTSGTDYVYWFGSGWSHSQPEALDGNGGVKDFQCWQSVLQEAARRLREPLSVRVRK